MATINNIYIWVEREDISRPIKIPQHPVEKGLPITDNVRKEPKTLSISGKIVDTSNLKAKAIIDKIEALKNSGSLIKYNGLNVLGNYLISSFNTSEDNRTWGGANFDMELVEARIAKSAYDPSKQKAAEKSKQVNNPTLKVGAIVVFKGGSVYVSSDATKAAATRGRSTCKITIINNRSWSKHDYHLISTDGKKVYGWVDKENIEGTGSSGTSAVTNGGTQQPKSKTNTATENKVTNVKYGGKLTNQLFVGSKATLDKNTVTSTINGSRYYLNGGKLYPITYAKTSRAGYYFPEETPYYYRTN